MTENELAIESYLYVVPCKYLNYCKNLVVSFRKTLIDSLWYDILYEYVAHTKKKISFHIELSFIYFLVEPLTIGIGPKIAVKSKKNQIE